MSDDHDYAVYSEYSPEPSKLAIPGFNPRIFTHVEACSGRRIRLNMDNGVITLAPGRYHVNGFSAVVYSTLDEPKGMVSVQSPSNGGYCRLRYYEDEDEDQDQDTDFDLDESNKAAIVVGSVATANMIPSLFETYFKTDEEARIILEHQSGDCLKDIYLRQYSDDSLWHLFARIALRRL